ncbi:MAG: efflux RND transporter permease subunit [Endomicrobia bacterium]|nr:efflux RND transporter permease subunit [Endomicrobiia bacterium]MCL2507375.1 efflux RND transporter permease subunit [Endomicrobiia bacterium]
MNLARLAIKRPTFVFSILMAMLVLGLVSLSKLSVRMFPDVEFPYVGVITAYPGAGVNEIEQLVTKPIEDAMSGVSGLKHVMSINQDNVSIVFGEFNLSKDPEIAAQEVRDKVGQIRLLLPDNINEPIVMKADMDNMPLITLVLKSNYLTPKELYDFADDVVSKDFAQVSGISQIGIVGGQKREIQIQADKNKLKTYDLTLGTLAARILANSLNVPAGSVNRGPTQLAYRTMGEFLSIKKIGDVVVNFMGNDRPVTVRDVAKVVDGVQEETSRARLNTKDDDGEIKSENALIIQLYRQAKGNDVAISDEAQAKLKELSAKYHEMRGNPELALINDTARGVRMNIADVKDTILEGIFLAIIVVYFFLGSWRSTVITALALPNSLIGAFLFMYIFGFSLNVISLMSLALAVGLLIDDAIIVRENIFRRYEEGEDPVTSAIKGTDEVTLAVVATTLAVIAVFFPVSFLSGIMGQFFREFGLTVVFAMCISLFDALTVAPMLSAYFIPSKDAKFKKNPSKIKAVFASAGSHIVKIFRAMTVGWFNPVFKAVEDIYVKTIGFILKTKGMKLVTFGATLFIIICVIFAVKMGALKLNFMPSSDWGEFNVNVRAKPGTSLDRMDQYSKEIELFIMNQPEVELVSASIGSTGMYDSPANEATLYVKMHQKSSEKSTIKKYVKGIIAMFRSSDDVRNTAQMKDYLRTVFSEKYGDELNFSYLKSGSLGGGRSEFVVELTGADVDKLYSVAQVLMKRYAEIPHFVDIRSNYQPGKPEIQIQMDTDKMESFGVSSVMAGNEIRGMIDGIKAGKFRENGMEYDIRVKFQDDQKDIAQIFDNIYINNVNGKLVRLKNVARLEMVDGPTQIFRKDRARFVSVEGNLSAGGTIGAVQGLAFKIFNEEKLKNPDWAHIELRASGNAEEMANMVQSIMIAALLSLVFIFMVLSSLYESVITPFTIMSALPLAIVGAILALIIARQPADMFTLIGMIMLLGIVAKNSILLVDFIQQRMRAGHVIDDAIVISCRTRFRPILMTSFALIAGMLPTALGLTEVGSFRKGMGIVVIGGIISSTVLTLIVVPAIFEYMDMLRRFLRRIFNRPEHRMVDLSDDELKKMDL